MPIDPGGAFTLILEPVQGCNLRCRYCYADTSAAAFMSRQTLQSALVKTSRSAERQGLKEMHLLCHGGEPRLGYNNCGEKRSGMKQSINASSR